MNIAWVSFFFHCPFDVNLGCWAIKNNTFHNFGAHTFIISVKYIKNELLGPMEYVVFSLSRNCLKPFSKVAAPIYTHTKSETSICSTPFPINNIWFFKLLLYLVILVQECSGLNLHYIEHIFICLLSIWLSFVKYVFHF